MFCPKHPNQKMTVLFSSSVCDVCDPPNKNTLESAPKKHTSRLWTVGFGPIWVPPSTITIVQAMPMVDFKGKKIINTGDDDSLLFITGFFVGYLNQLPNQIAIPVTNFKQAVPYQLDFCHNSQSITVEIKNTGPYQAKWAMDIIGEAVFSK